MLKVVAKNYVEPSRRAEMLRLAGELTEITRKEPGCLSYGAYEDKDHPELLTMIEEWESREALEAHLHSADFCRIVPQMNLLTTRETEMNLYESVL